MRRNKLIVGGVICSIILIMVVTLVMVIYNKSQ
jgi:hypothetical protein